MPRRYVLLLIGFLVMLNSCIALPYPKSPQDLKFESVSVVNSSYNEETQKWWSKKLLKINFSSTIDLVALSKSHEFNMVAHFYLCKGVSGTESSSTLDYSGLFWSTLRIDELRNYDEHMKESMLSAKEEADEKLYNHLIRTTNGAPIIYHAYLPLSREKPNDGDHTAPPHPAYDMEHFPEDLCLELEGGSESWDGFIPLATAWIITSNEMKIPTKAISSAVK